VSGTLRLAQEFIDHPEVLAMTIRGMLWAAGKKDI